MSDPAWRGNDGALVRAAQAGQAAAFEELYRRHFPGAYRVALVVCRDPAAAEDITQEAFLAAVRNLDRFDRSRRFAPWLARIVSNRAIDWVRAHQRRAETAPLELTSGDPAVPDSAASLVELVGGLPPDQRVVVALRYVLGFEPTEIARLLELPRGTVNSRLRRGLDAIERHLEAER